GGMGGAGAMGGDGGGTVDPPLGPNQLVNGDFEAFTANSSGPFDPPDSWNPFGAIFNPGFTAVGYTAFGTQAHGANIFPSTVPFPGFMMSRALKVFGISADAGGGNVEPSLGTIFQEYTGTAIPPAGAQLRLTGYAYHASQDPLGPQAQAYLVIKCLDGGFANLCAGTESTPITMSTTADTWLPFSVDLVALPAGTAYLQAGVEFKQCGGPGGTACTGADGAGSVYFDELVFSNNAGNLAINGDFEAGNTSGWQDFAVANNGTFAATMTQQNGGLWSGNLTAAVPNVGDPASFPVIKQANLGIGTVQPNQTIDVQFDLFGSVQGAGGVFFAEFFSEVSGGGTSKADILSGGPLFPTAPNDWTAGWVTYQFTVTTGPDVSAGVTLQLKADCGGNVGCQVDTYIDNVSITIP
ncbi:MAG: hypothetical protein KC731_12440, partial [Myxococcales bacterium]|nr:hypothetical protein [Myxococcales bacterium]